MGDAEKSTRYALDMVMMIKIDVDLTRDTHDAALWTLGRA